MTPGRLIISGAGTGVVVASLFFIADLLGAAFAIGSLFDPKPAQFLLLAIAWAIQASLGALIGGGLALAWRLIRKSNFRRPPWAKVAVGAVTLMLLVVGYTGRVARTETHEGTVQGPARADSPPVLWIVVDTLRADTLYGAKRDFPLAPNLKSFARDALVFSDVESGAGWTIPSVATMLTGIQPVTLYSARGFLPAWAPTAAERLHAAGYSTHAFQDNALLESRNGFADGFETFFQRSALRFAFSLPAFRLIPTLWRESLRESFVVFYHGAEGLTEQALARLEQVGDRAPFFYVHYMDVHYPYYPHPEIAKDPEDTEPVMLHYAMRQVREDPNNRPNDAQMRFLKHRYEGELTYLDREMGRLLAAWEKRFGGDSLVVITADHGEEFLEHGELGHGHSLHRELVNVPLIVRLPKKALKPERVSRWVDTPVSQVDLLPTLLDVLDISHELANEGIDMDGHSWWPYLKGEAEPPTAGLFATQSRNGRRIYRWRQNNWARISTYYHKGGEAAAVYDLDRDPAEQKNLRSSERAREVSLTKSLDPLVEAWTAARDPKPISRSEDAEALRALGYIE